MSDTMDEDLVGFFLKEKPCRALYAIENLGESESYGSNVSTEVDTTYAHTVKIIDQMCELGLVESEKDGRKKMLRLTERGEEILEHFKPMIRDSFNRGSSLELGGEYGGENLQ